MLKRVRTRIGFTVAVALLLGGCESAPGDSSTGGAGHAAGGSAGTAGATVSGTGGVGGGAVVVTGGSTGSGAAGLDTGGAGGETGGSSGNAGSGGGTAGAFGSGGRGSGGSGGSGGAALGTGGTAAGRGGAGGGAGMAGGGVAGAGGSAGLDLRDVVARLTGEKPITGSTRLAHRASETERESTRVYLLQVLGTSGLTAERHMYATGTNVFADLAASAGADGKPYVVFGAHFDSVTAGPGANDNATGVAAVLAVAEHVARLPARAKNFTFVLFDEEEVGLRGSAAFAIRLMGQNRTVHSVRTIDQMGWDNDGDRAIELEMPTAALRTYYQQMATAGAFNIPLEITDTTSTDHASFRSRGFAAIGITEEYRNNDTTPYYHKAGDTYATVNFDYLESTVAYLKYLMADLAK
jgi:hypothetical protein